MKKIFCISIFAFILTQANISTAMHGTRGGGNFTAAKFIALAREIKVTLTMADAWAKIGVSASDYERAISQTSVVCASGNSLKGLVKNQQHAFYEPSKKTIYLNCEIWNQKINTGMKVTLFHEYMRVLGKEDSNYEVSSRIINYLPTGDSYTATEDLEQAIRDGNIQGIFQAVNNGADLNYFASPSIYSVVSKEGAKWTQNSDGVLMDSQSGPLFSIDEKVALIFYLKSMGADPNVKDYSSGKTAMHATYDPVVMEALLKVGGDPKLKSKDSGEEPLISFMYGYGRYKNSAYFRIVVKYMLDLGADPESCFKDHSACVLDVAKDEPMRNLIKSYLKK